MIATRRFTRELGTSFLPFRNWISDALRQLQKRGEGFVGAKELLGTEPSPAAAGQPSFLIAIERHGQALRAIPSVDLAVSECPAKATSPQGRRLARGTRNESQDADPSFSFVTPRQRWTRRNERL
jgi:hypothetical protein